MNILIDIGHPGHVHLLHWVAEELKRHGHTLFYSVRNIPIAKRLMEYYGMTPYIDLGDKKDSLLGKAQTILQQDIQIANFVRKNHIDLGLSSGLVLSHVSKISHMKDINIFLVLILFLMKQNLSLSLKAKWMPCPFIKLFTPIPLLLLPLQVPLKKNGLICLLKNVRT